MRAYARQPVSFVCGSGARLWDDQGTEYLDAIAGVAVTSLGHAHPEIAAVIAEQAATLLHTSNVFRIEWQEQLGERLCALTGMEQAFFCNSGAEANEAALKLARLHAQRKQIDQPRIVVLDNAFHGCTIATLSATGQPERHAVFAPLLSGFVRLPYDDIGALRAARGRGAIARHCRRADPPRVLAIRGQGLMVGVELDRSCSELVGRALEEQQLLITVTQGSVIRLLPPLICDERQIDAIVARIARLLSPVSTNFPAKALSPA